VGLARAGEDIRLDVRRDGQTRQVIVRSGLRPDEKSLASNDREPSGPSDQADEGTRVLGMTLAPNDKGAGVAVAGVTSSSDAAAKGLRRGDVILRAGTREVATADDVSAAVAEARKAGRGSVLLQVARNGQRMFLPLKIDQGRG
jgi:serine protease Do